MSDQQGSSLEIITIALASVSLIVVLVRGIARYRIVRVSESTDILLPLALSIALAQSTFVYLAISNGLGRHVTTLTEDELLWFQKFTYASNLLFQLLLSLCQIVIILLIRSVEPQRPVRVGCNTLLAFIGLHATVSLTVLALQCSLPEPWVFGPEQCLNRQAFFTAFIIAGVFIDFLTLVLPIVMVCKLKTSRDKKIFVCILFGARLSVPILTVPQIWKLQGLLDSKDHTWDHFQFQIWIQIIMNLSLITACLPSLGRMMWEIWAFGSGLRTTRRSRGTGSRDFGHELGLENGQAPMKEKSGIPTEVGQFKVHTREVRSFDSGSTIVDPQKILPALPRRTTSRFRPVRKHAHHYRRPNSFLPPSGEVDYLPAMQFSALDMPSPTTIVRDSKRQLDNHKQQAFPFPPQATLLPRAAPVGHGQYPDNLSAYSTKYPSPLQSPTLPHLADSYHEQQPEMGDHSSVDIDSYYHMHNIDPANTSRTELVLQQMIEELQSQNGSIYGPTRQQRQESSIYSSTRMQSSVYSVRTRNDGGWI